MKGIIIFFARRPVTVIMIMAAIIIAAIFAFTVLPLNRLPELSVPVVTVETVYPGMAAAEIRALVTIPVEDAFSSVKGLDRIQSVSRDGSSLVKLDFRWGVDSTVAAALVREAVDAVYPSLPQGVRKPSVSSGDSGMEPHAIIAVQSLSGDESFARRLADYDIRSGLRRIDGVGSVLLAGGVCDEGHLRLDVHRLAALGLSPLEFINLLSGEAVDIPAGNAREGLMELVVVSSGRPDSIEELASFSLPLQTTQAGRISSLFISDTGTIGIEAGRKSSIFVFNGEETAALEIYRRPGSDPVRLSRDIRKAIKEMDLQFSHNARITLVKDAAPVLVQSMISLGISALLSAAAVIIVLLAFLRRLRTSFLAALSIPLSVAAGICVLAAAGKTLNSMSLGGLALGIGIVSDIAVIMLDLLSRCFEKYSKKPTPEETGERAVLITGSSIASTLTTAVVFIPVIFLPGPLGSLFGDTAIALVSSIFAGWLYAQFCIPSLYRFTFFNGINKNKNNYSLESRYRKSLAPVLRRPRKWFVIAAAASVLGGFLLFARPAAFVGSDTAEEIVISAEFNPGTILENIGVFGAVLSGEIVKLPYIKAAYGRAGAEEADINRRSDMDYRKEELVIRCIPQKGVKIEKALNSIRNTVPEIIRLDAALETRAFPNAISVFLPGDGTETILGLSSVLTYAVRGKDREEGVERAGVIKERLKENGLAGTVQYRPRSLRPELRLYPNREAAAHFGVSAADMAHYLYIVNEGFVAASLETEGRPLDIRVSGDRVSFENIPVKTRQGTTVFLGSLGHIERREADAVLPRLDRSDVVFMDIPQEKLWVQAAHKLASSFSWFFKADESVFDRYRNALLINILLAIVLIYMTMSAQFESFLLPLVLMLTIPFSIAGAGPVLLAFNGRLDSGAVLGLCALFGLVVNNGLILFEISEERINCGYRPARAVYGGAAIRLRPVLITAFTTIFALLPIALNPLGSAQKSMAAAMLGGLMVSTVLSLFILPPVFIRFFTWRERR
ncbi:MAG: efflux RND transporter permease subunit [Treponema sp.]|nr:efflux RND transporter permease subunit [Treponema sp.]